jgi:1-aminocyclopropane-1-carboxylate deaminase/D-cysteine desulfhydrase-like pyridoxal-dependent ACC family enzyme
VTPPRVALLPTPLEPAPRLGGALGLDLWIKREDLSGTGLGGNKLRQIDAILDEAAREGADALVTTAGAQSNFCRALAAGCAKRGLACLLLLRGEDGAPLTGNLLLDKLFGAEVRFIPALDPWSAEVVERLEAAGDELHGRGLKPKIVHLPGRTAALAAAAWAEGAAELDAQFREAGIVPARIVVAAGSGLTAAGLAAGFARLGDETRIHVVSVQQPAARLRAWIDEVIARLADAQPEYDVTDDEIAPGYGLPSPAALDAILLAARTEGLVLDPAYTGKAMAGLVAVAPKIRGETVVFLHSGGTPGLFAQSAAVAERLA